MWIYSVIVVLQIIGTQSHASAECQDVYQEIRPLTIPSTPNEVTSSSLSLIWRQKHHRLLLHRTDSSTSSGIAEWYADGNVTRIESLSDDVMFYQGHVIGANYSFIALEIKQGVSGYIQLDGEGISVEPVGETRSSSQLHRFYSCGVSDMPTEVLQLKHKTRKRRSTPSTFTKYLEVMVVADTSVVQYVGEDKIKAYIMALMNIVNTVYHDHTLGINMEVVTVKIMFMDKVSERQVVAASSPQRTVEMFCQWVSQQSHSSRSGTFSHDAAVLLTRNKFAPAGYAPITGMCIPTRSCALVKDDGFTSAFVIAHEVAHIIGLMHDGHGNECHGREYTTSIMATVVQSSFNHYWWSSCSRQRMHEVIHTLPCLNNNPHQVIKDDLPYPLGVSYSLDEQCRLEFGDKARFCTAFGMMDPCTQLWCDDGTRRYTCKTKNVIPLEGTQCGPSPKWYCKDSKCSYHGSETPIHGGWSGWSTWSNCSAQCDVGFKRRSRMCNNPTAQYGGSPCEGESEDTDTCIAEECTYYIDQREFQCELMNEVQYKGRSLTWLPYQIHIESDLCKLTCVSEETNEVVTFDRLVENGTPCSYDNPNHICMAGKCEKVGCDGVLGSDMVVDNCGVCNGDGSTCKRVTGRYNKKFEYSAAGGSDFETILVLPKGARDIVIKEQATLPHFLSVQGSQYQDSPLNGDGRQGASKNFVLEGSWFKYNNQNGYETLGTKGPLRDNVYIRVYPMSFSIPANIDYSYTVDQNDYTLEKTKYFWKYEDWSPCSVTCGKGVQHIIYGCYTRDDEEKVKDELCQYVDMYTKEDVQCTMFPCEALVYNWRMLKNYTSCSATCGDTGVRYRHYECEELATGDTVDNKFCNHAQEPLVEQPCNRIKCGEIKYVWQLENRWGPCSASCGNTGFRNKQATCMQIINKMDRKSVADKHCAYLELPAETRPCNRMPCVSYRWEPKGDWQACNSTCGATGSQKRYIACNKYIGDELMSAVAHSYCGKGNMVFEEQACNRRPCYIISWVLTDDWSPCSISCGAGGIQERIVQCQNVTHDQKQTTILHERHCNATPKTLIQRSCQRSDCLMEQYHWNNTLDWSKCSVTCGHGIQEMEMQCVKTDGDVVVAVDDGNCVGVEKIPVTRDCNAGLCGYLEWGAGPWSPCSRSCGNGRQKRIVYCGEVDDIRPVERCPGRAPIEYQHCNERPCIATTSATTTTTITQTLTKSTPAEEERQNNNAALNLYKKSKKKLVDSNSNIDKKENKNTDKTTVNTDCTGDRAPFCKRANLRSCSHPAYARACCESCAKYVNDNGDPKSRTKSFRRRRRNHL